MKVATIVLLIAVAGLLIAGADAGGKDRCKKDRHCDEKKSIAIAVADADACAVSSGKLAVAVGLTDSFAQKSRWGVEAGASALSVSVAA